MSLERFIKDVMSQIDLGKLPPSVVINFQAPVTINVNPDPANAAMSVEVERIMALMGHVGFGSSGWKKAEELGAQAERKRQAIKATQSTDPDAEKEPWQTPEAADQLRRDMEKEAKKPAGFNGDVTKGMLLRFAAEHDFSVQTARRLYAFLTGWRLPKYLAMRDAFLQVGDNGGFRKRDLKKVCRLLDPKSDDKLLYGYGDEQHALLRAVAQSRR